MIGDLIGIAHPVGVAGSAEDQLIHDSAERRRVIADSGGDAHIDIVIVSIGPVAHPEDQRIAILYSGYLGRDDPLVVRSGAASIPGSESHGTAAVGRAGHHTAGPPGNRGGADGQLIPAAAAVGIEFRPAGGGKSPFEGLVDDIDAITRRRFTGVDGIDIFLKNRKLLLLSAGITLLAERQADRGNQEDNCAELYNARHMVAPLVWLNRLNVFSYWFLVVGFWLLVFSCCILITRSLRTANNQ